MEAGPTNVPRRNLPATVAIVGACAALLVALAGAFYLSGARRVFDGEERVSVAISACVIAIPWLMVTLAIALRRMGAALAMAMSSAAAFLLYVAWQAIVMTEPWWEHDPNVSLSVAMVLVHMAALAAAIFAWRNLAPGERAFEGKTWFALLPIVVACALAALT